MQEELGGNIEQLINLFSFWLAELRSASPRKTNVTN